MTGIPRIEQPQPVLDVQNTRVRHAFMVDSYTLHPVKLIPFLSVHMQLVTRLIYSYLSTYKVMFTTTTLLGIQSVNLPLLTLWSGVVHSYDNIGLSLILIEELFAPLQE